MANMWWLDLAVAVGFVIGVAVKQLIDLHNERAQQAPEVAKPAKRQRRNPPPP